MLNKNILMYVIENNDNNLNNQQGVYSNKRLYFDEIILSVNAWRENGGWLKDIPIYAICPTTNTLNEEETKQLRDLNVIYLEEYMKETEDFFCGYWNVPLVGKWCEENLDFDTMIHIDCDMTLIKPLPETLVNYHDPVCGVYDINSMKDQRELPEDWFRPFDTGFTISKKTSGFYTTFHNVLEEVTDTLDPVWLEYMSQRPVQDIEEFAMDKIYNEKLLDMTYIEKYQIGEGYASVDTLTDDEVEEVYFWHEHILHEPYYDRIKEKIKYFKRIKNINKLSS